jgi:hypothetical protein
MDVGKVWIFILRLFYFKKYGRVLRVRAGGSKIRYFRFFMAGFHEFSARAHARDLRGLATGTD